MYCFSCSCLAHALLNVSFVAHVLNVLFMSQMCYPSCVLIVLLWLLHSNVASVLLMLSICVYSEKWWLMLLMLFIHCCLRYLSLYVLRVCSCSPNSELWGAYVTIELGQVTRNPLSVARCSVSRCLPVSPECLPLCLPVAPRFRYPLPRVGCWGSDPWRTA